MGNKQCRLCVSASGSPPIEKRGEYVPVERSHQELANQQVQEQPNLQHIADRERVEGWEIKTFILL